MLFSFKHHCSSLCVWVQMLMCAPTHLEGAADPSLHLVFQYKTKISDEMDLKRRIQSLEESMELHERMKKQALAEFESYRQRVEDLQLCTEAQVGPLPGAHWFSSSVD